MVAGSAVCVRGVPHLRQNADCSEFSREHWGQIIAIARTAFQNTVKRVAYCKEVVCLVCMYTHETCPAGVACAYYRGFFPKTQTLVARHPPLAKTTNNHSSFRQRASDEMGAFYRQSCCLLRFRYELVRLVISKRFWCCDARFEPGCCGFWRISSGNGSSQATRGGREGAIGQHLHDGLTNDLW